MTMTEAPTSSQRTPDLRPILARLEEIARKCEAMGARNLELPDMAVRVREVIRVLQSQGDAEVDFRDLARRLFPVARAFESLGFHSVAREIAHVERSLEALAPPSEAGSRTATSARNEPSDASSPRPATPPAAAGDETPDHLRPDDSSPPRRRIPPAVLLAATALVLTLAVCALVIVTHDPLAGAFAPTPVATEPPPTPAPSPTHPVATPTSVELQRNADRTLMVDAVSEARRSLQTGNAAVALEHLNQAALVDPTAGLVLEVADEIVAFHLRQAELSIDRAAWEEAESSLAEAAGVSRRFGLDVGSVDSLRRRLEGMTRYRLIGPGETAALREAVGLPVEVFRERGEPDRGILDRVEGDVLVIRTDREVGGGSILFLERIPLDTVRFVKAYPE